MKRAIYPGSFDPVTNGHLDVIARAARLLDKLVVGVAISSGKGPLFSLEERVELMQAEIARIATQNGMVIEVLPYDTLLVDFARKVGASMIVRGLRAVSDFDYEFQMAGMNYRMAPGDTDPRDAIQVIDFNKKAGDNFKVYYSLEAPSKVAPCNDSRAGIGGWVCK